VGDHHHLFWTSLALVAAIAAAVGVVNLVRRRQRKDSPQVKDLPQDYE
jgi:anti-sigma-K factor RskA